MDFSKKPKALTCFICNREFGTNSLQIHMKQCIKKSDNPNIQIPDYYNNIFNKINNGEKLSENDYENTNETAYKDYKEVSLFPCPNCNRRFLPDRLEVHLRSCRGNDNYDIGSKKNVAFSSNTKFNKNSSNNTSTVSKFQYNNLSKSSGNTDVMKNTSMTKLPNISNNKNNNTLSKSIYGNNFSSAVKNNSKSVSKFSQSNSNKSNYTQFGFNKKPLMLVCYVCGREFSKHSIDIHLEQCMDKHVNEEINAGVPKHKIFTPNPPDILITIIDKVHNKEQVTADEINSYNSWAENMYKEVGMRQCSNCKRKFAKDRLDVHLKSCNPQQLSSNTTSGNRNYNSIYSGENNSNNTSNNYRAKGQRPQMHMCPLCGREYGSLSLDIHMKTCVIKFDKAQEDLPKNKRRSAESIIQKYNQTKIGINTNGNYNLDAINNQMFNIYNKEALVPCERCGRTFLPDRLIVHLRSCKGPK